VRRGVNAKSVSGPFIYDLATGAEAVI
jgi:hypothetical protein